MKPVVIDNFLDEQSFRNLQNVILGNDFTWFYINSIDYSDEEGDKFQFFHAFFKEAIGVNSHQCGILSNILNKIKPKDIFRIKANLLTRTSKIEVNTFHSDIVDLGILPWTTSILYINTNNGMTTLEDGAKIDSVENRALLFDGLIKHCSSTCTNSRSRLVVNVNYI